MGEIKIEPYEPSMILSVAALIERNEMSFEGNELPSHGFVASFQDSIIGYVAGYHTFANNAMVAMLVVDEEARHLGVGKALLHNMFTLFESRGWTHIAAFTQQNNEDAIAMYDSLDIPKEPVYLLESDVYKLIESTK